MKPDGWGWVGLALGFRGNWNDNGMKWDGVGGQRILYMVVKCRFGRNWGDGR